MEKKLWTLTLLLCPLVLSQGTINGMEEKTVEETTTTLAPNRCFFDQLRMHPKFINANSDEQVAPQVQPTEEQVQLNLAISQLMSGSVALPQEAEETSQNSMPASTKTGFNWTLRLKSITHSAPDLLDYALTNDMFEHDNNDHLDLLSIAINECIDMQAYDKLVKILTFTKEKYADKLELDPKITERIYSFLTKQQAEQRTTFIQNFAQLNAQQQIVCKAAVSELQKQYETTISETTRLMNDANSEYEIQKKAFRTQTNKDKTVISALRKLSSPTLDIKTPDTSWSSLIQGIPNAATRINLTTATLNNGKPAIQGLSTYLLIEDKQ